MCIILAVLSGVIPTSPYSSIVYPILSEWCQQSNSPASQYFMPIMISITQGGLFTSIGVSSTILLNGILSSYKIPQIQFIEILYVSGPVFLLLLLYMTTIGPFLLPKKYSMLSIIKQKGKTFKTQWKIPKKFHGKKIGEMIMKSHFEEIQILELMRFHSKEHIYDKKKVLNSDLPNEENHYHDFDEHEAETHELEKNEKLETKESTMEKTFYIIEPKKDLIIEEEDVLIIEASLDRIYYFLNETGVISDLKMKASKPSLFDTAQNDNNPIPSLDKNVDISSPSLDKPRGRSIELKDLKSKLDIKSLLKQEKPLSEKFEFLEIIISSNNPFLNQNYLTSNFRFKYQFFIIAIQKNGEIHENLCNFKSINH